MDWSYGQTMPKVFKPHQATAFASYVGLPAFPCLMEMRLGKTLVIIRWTMEAKPRRVLVVCPLTPMDGWISDLEDEGHHAAIRRGGEWMGFSDCVWHLCTYQTLARDPEVAKQRWDAVILDESTQIKNPQNKSSKICVRRLSKAPKRAILSGCIDPEDVTDVWSQMAFCMGGSWMGHSNFYKWRQHHQFKAGFSWEFKAGREQLTRDELAKTAYVVTRKSAGVGNEKVRVKRTAPMDPEAKALQKKIGKEWSSQFREAKHSVAIATWLHRVAGGHTPEGHELPCWKVQEVVDLVTGELAGQQFVVWFAYSHEMRRVHRALKEAGVLTHFVQGSTPLEDRRARRLSFERKERRGMLMSGACGKFGYDLSASDVSIYYSSSWSGETRKQSEDRIESIHKTASLLIVDLISIGSSDEDVYESVTSKNHSSDETARYILSRQLDRLQPRATG